MVAVKHKYILSETEKNLLKDHYYTASKPGALGGVQALSRATNLHPQKVIAWLRQQWTYTLHKPVRKKFPTRRYVVRGVNHQWQIDLVEMQHYAHENNGHRYMLTAIDVFSRYAYARPLKTKTGQEVATVLESIFEESYPKYIQADQGKEFYNHYVLDLCEKYNIELFSVFSDKKAALVERFHRTLKNKMYRAFTHQGNHRWLKLLPRLLENYNHSYHRGIKRMPASINKQNETDVWLTQYAKIQKPNPRAPTKFNVGDRVLIPKLRTAFMRGYLPGWSNEEFIITDINVKYKPILYSLQDLDGLTIKGSFYDHELQKIDNPDNLFRIEKVIRTRGVGAMKKAYVKWMGYKEPTWIPYSDIQHVSNV